MQFPHSEPDICEYLRQLTWLWTGLFLVNAVVCAILAGFAPERIWMIYTGLVIYVLMGILLVGEYLYRPRRFPDLEIPRPLDSLKTMARNGHKIFMEFR